MFSEIPFVDMEIGDTNSEAGMSRDDSEVQACAWENGADQNLHRKAVLDFSMEVVSWDFKGQQMKTFHAQTSSLFYHGCSLKGWDLP